MNVQDLIVNNHAKEPLTEQLYEEGDYVLYVNNRYGTKKLLKFAPAMAGPVNVEKKLQGDFYDLHDLVQDTILLSHASDMRPFACDSDDEARNIDL